MKRQTVLFVDGYNMIGSWPELEHLKNQDQIQAARDLLLFELSNYAKYRGIEVIVVFDAHLVPGMTRSYEQYELEVVFTQEGETADEYIERVVQDYINPLTQVIVATSDGTEQWVVFQQGALRQSAEELRIEINYAKGQIQKDVDHHYDNSIRRRSPWREDQLKQLDDLLNEIERKN